MGVDHHDPGIVFTIEIHSNLVHFTGLLRSHHNNTLVSSPNRKFRTEKTKIPSRFSSQSPSAIHRHYKPSVKSRNLLLQQLVSQHEEGSSQTGSEENDEESGQLVPVGQAERQVLQTAKNKRLIRILYNKQKSLPQ